MTSLGGHEAALKGKGWFALNQMLTPDMSVYHGVHRVDVGQKCTSGFSVGMQTLQSIQREILHKTQLLQQKLYGGWGKSRKRSLQIKRFQRQSSENMKTRFASEFKQIDHFLKHVLGNSSSVFDHFMD